MKIGTIGTGSIVATMIENMQRTKYLNVQAIYSRKKETAREMADRFHVTKIYTDLDLMYQDDDIDCIYIASPNSLHYEHTKKALQSGKHVICEKPFTPTLKEARELSTLAKSKHLLLFEAITTVHHPNFAHIREYLPLIGDINLVLCTFCQYSSRYDVLQAGGLPNVFNPAFAGGALMDINLYNVYFVSELFGMPVDVQYYPTLHPNGIDTNGILILKYPDFLCQCTGAKDSFCENGVQLLGDKGYIHVTAASNSCDHIRVVRKGKPDITFAVAENQWYYEAQALSELLGKMDYDTCYKRLDKTLEVVDILEKARKSAGMCF